MRTFANPTVRGEQVEVIAPKPAGWQGLGQTYDPAILVRYPDGEIGAVPEEAIREAPAE